MSTHDHPTLNDMLDRASLAQALAVGCRDCVPPRVVGIHGDWGAGKTSVLRTIQYALGAECAETPSSGSDLEKRLSEIRLEDADKDFAVIWFEAWRYQNESAPVVALLHEIRAQLAWYMKAWNITAKSSLIAIEAALAHMEQLTLAITSLNPAAVLFPQKGTSLVATIREIGERREKASFAEKLPADSIRERLEHALRQLLGEADGKPPRRLVILVDDLDRCEPTAAFRLLEGIKLYLNLPNCVFVMGMDERIVQEAVAATMPEDLSRSDRLHRAHEYLEKIFQEVHRLPRPRSMEKLIDLCLPIRTTMGEPWTTVNSCLNDYPELVPGIPRRVKLFCQTLNRFVRQEQVVWERRRGELAPEDAPKLHQPLAMLAVTLAYIYQFHPEIYRLLESHPSAYSQVRDWCRTGTSNLESLKDVRLLEGTLPPAPSSTSSPNPAASGGSSEAPRAPKLEFLYPDYSRGNVFRAQRLVTFAGSYEPEVVQSMLI